MREELQPGEATAGTGNDRHRGVGAGNRPVSRDGVSRRAFIAHGLVGAGALVIPASFSLLTLSGCGPQAATAATGAWPWGAARTAAQTAAGYTSIQCDGPYLSGWDWQTDVVLAYFDNGTVDYETQFGTWKGHGYRVGTMLAATHDWQGTFTRGLYDKQTHYDLVQTNRDGSYVEDTGGAYWMVPAGGWLEYLQTLCKRAIDAGSRLIVFDEPMYAYSSGYETLFQSAWVNAYGRPWEAQTSSAQALWDTCQLKAQMWVEAFKQLGGWIHQYNADVKIYPAPHAVLDFAMWGVIFPHADVLALPEIDGLFYEVWGTFQTRTEEQSKILPWERAYAEYAMSGGLSFRSGKGMKVMAQTAGTSAHQYPVGDMACALMTPWAESFHVGPASRSGFATPGPGLGHDRIMNMARLYEGLPGAENLDGIDSGCAGLAVAVADTLMYENGQGAPSDVRSWEGLFFPMTRAGLLPSCPALEALERAAYLDRLGTRCLLLEYEDMPPNSAAMNGQLAAWVQAGGVLVVFGGKCTFDSVSAWWQKAGFNRPQDDLFVRLGVHVQGGSGHAGADWVSVGSHWAEHLGFAPVLTAGPAFPIVGYAGVSGAQPLFQAGQNTVAFETTAGKGHLLFFGCSPSYFAYSAEGTALLQTLITELYQHQGLGKCVAQGHWGIDRGPVVMRRVVQGTVPLRGRFLRLTEGGLPLEVDPVLEPAPEPHVLLQVPWSGVSPPKVLFSNLRLSEVSEGRTQTVFTGAGQVGAPGATRIWAPGRKVAGVKAVEATSGGGSGQLPVAEQLVQSSATGLGWKWDAASESLLVTVNSLPAGVTTTVVWQ